jgi:hypothetical protein
MTRTVGVPTLCVPVKDWRAFLRSVGETEDVPGIYFEHLWVRGTGE